MRVVYYPVLQAADIVLHRAKYVPVGKDQEQHTEMARTFVNRFTTDTRCAARTICIQLWRRIGESAAWMVPVKWNPAKSECHHLPRR